MKKVVLLALGMLLHLQLKADTFEMNDLNDLKPHEGWWAKHFNDPNWLGGIQMASRAVMRQHVAQQKYTSILDIPCGYCQDRDGLIYEKIPVEYYGVDITKKIVDYCREHGANVVQGRIEHIPFQDNFVDMTYSRHILEHLEYYEQAIRDLVRVARKEVFIAFFKKPHDAPDSINPGVFYGDPLFHNVYDKRKMETFIASLEKFDHLEWQDIDATEVILHIYLKQPEGKQASACVPTVDFDTSLGKNEILTVDGVSYSLFDDFLSPNPRFNVLWDFASKPRPINELYSFLKNLYIKNAPNCVKQSTTYKIPPCIHQIWIQGGELPEQYRIWQQSWIKMFPGWEYKLWTDKEIRQLKLHNQKLYDEATNYGAKSDIARYEILYQHGGVYMDGDFQSIKPEMFDYLHRSYTFYAGIAPLDCAHLVIANGLFASAPGHPILKDIIEYLEKNYDTSTQVHLRGGPIPFTKAFWRSADQLGYTDIALPPTFFYPVGMYGVRGRAYNTSAHYQDLIKPETMAIHYWGHSWIGTPRY